MAGCIVTRNIKHIKTIPFTAKQYLRDQLTQHTDHPVDRILKQYETPSMDKVQSNNSNKWREETHTNRTHMNKHSDIQICDTQGHTVNTVSNNRELTENSDQTVRD